MTNKRNLKLGVLCAAVALAPAAFVRAADDAAALKDRLHRVAELNSIEDPQLKPWHLKLSYQLFDDKGKPSEQGTIEGWYSGKKLWKMVYTSPSSSGIRMSTADGIYVTKNFDEPATVTMLLAQTLRPVSLKAINEGQLRLQHLTIEKVPLDCISHVPAMPPDEKPTTAYPTYCMGKNGDFLRMSYFTLAEIYVRSKLGTFQGRQVPIDLSIVQGSINEATSHVETLAEETIADSVFVPGPEMSKESPTVSGSVMAGHILSQPRPQSPSGLSHHWSGVVILSVKIGVDGKVHGIKVISSPSPVLTLPATQAVQQWTYSPYLLNGAPVEVTTTVTVNFQ